MQNQTSARNLLIDGSVYAKFIRLNGIGIDAVTNWDRCRNEVQICQQLSLFKIMLSFDYEYLIVSTNLLTKSAARKEWHVNYIRTLFMRKSAHIENAPTPSRSWIKKAPTPKKNYTGLDGSNIPLVHSSLIYTIYIIIMINCWALGPRELSQQLNTYQ